MIKQSINLPEDSIDNLHVELQKVEYQPMHYHPEMEIILVMSGDPIITINGEQKTYKEKDIIVISPHDTHSIYSPKEKSKLLILYIDPIFFTGYYSNMKDVRFTVNKLTSSDEDIFIYTFMTLARTYIAKSKYYQINCASYVNIMIYHILNDCDYYELSDDQKFDISLENKRISLIHEFIQLNYFKKIKLEDLADELGLSPSYVSRFIKKNLNRTFSDFLSYIRYVNAKRMIHEMDYSLIDISVIVGFSDYRYMNEAFKIHLDMTPNEYKQHLISKSKPNQNKNLNSIESNIEMIENMNQFMEKHKIKMH